MRKHDTAKATSRLQVNRVRGRRPVLQNCGIAELAIDAEYQRSIDNGPSQALIRRIARDWDWRLCQPLLVAGRGDEGLFVVDGQHRLAAARLRGDIYDLPCVIHGYADRAEEAAAFVSLNRTRKPLSALELFRASLSGGDAAASDVLRLILDAGLALAPHSNFTSWRPGMISNISGVQRCYAQHGEILTARTLQILAFAFEGEVLRYGGTLFSGIYPVLAELGQAADDGLLVMVLSAASQADWIRDIAAVEAERGIHRSKAASATIRAAYDEAASEDDVPLKAVC